MLLDHYSGVHTMPEVLATIRSLELLSSGTS